MSYPYQKAFRLADIYRAHWQEYLCSPSRKLKLEDKHFKAVNYTLSCRTSKMGYHYFKCSDCGHQHYLYHSCKHRFCGSCGSAETLRWAEKQLTTLLEMKHHHVVFTLPAALRSLCKRNGKQLYQLLFQSGQKALQDWFCYKHGIKCGIVSVLHTAGSDLKYHPHTHLIVSGGGLDVQTGEWKELEGDYLVNHKHLRKRFRKAFIEGLKQLYTQQELVLTGKAALHFSSFIDRLSQQDWIVSVQPPLHDRAHIVQYVGRYTKRACLSEYRIQQVSQGLIRFTFKDYRNSERNGPVKEATKQMDYQSFLDRLLQHVPEKGFRMVRYYGLYSNRYRSLRGTKVPTENIPKVESPFEQHSHYWQEVYQEDALTCKDCLKPFAYLGQYFPRKDRIIIKNKHNDYQDSS